MFTAVGLHSVADTAALGNGHNGGGSGGGGGGGGGGGHDGGHADAHAQWGFMSPTSDMHGLGGHGGVVALSEAEQGGLDFDHDHDHDGNPHHHHPFHHNILPPTSPPP